MTFGELQVGASFDFVDDSAPEYNSFFLRCIKTSDRTYMDSTGSRHAIGSLNAEVFHVEPKPDVQS